MQQLATRSQMQQIDKLAQEKYKLSSETLMEAAGALSAEALVSRFFHTKPIPLKKQALVLCGPGCNGGDGLVLARHLYACQVSVQVWASDSRTPLVKKKKSELRCQKIPIYSLSNFRILKKKLKPNFLIIDALFGVGLTRPLQGIYRQLVQWVNQAEEEAVALDIPSGLNADTGQTRLAVKAFETFTFGAAKPGLYLGQGPSCAGKVQVFPIGFPRVLLEETANTHYLVDKKWVAARLPFRKPTDHKARQGHLLVLAGSEGYWGAGLLCALAAYRMGCGYVTWAGGNGKEHPPLWPSPDKKTQAPIGPDILTQRLSDNEKLLLKKTAIAIGPGLGTGSVTKKLLLSLKKRDLPVVADASAVTLCIKEKLFPLPSHWILTPHSGELAPLFGVTGPDIDQDRCHYAKSASRKLGCWVLLKGFHTVLAQEEKCWIIPTGNAALAKAGTGDVLTGFIGALLARTLSPLEAALAAGFIHGMLADSWVESGRDADTLMAQDLGDLLPVLLRQLRKLS